MIPALGVSGETWHVCTCAYPCMPFRAGCGGKCDAGLPCRLARLAAGKDPNGKHWKPLPPISPCQTCEGEPDRCLSCSGGHNG